MASFHALSFEKAELKQLEQKLRLVKPGENQETILAKLQLQIRSAAGRRVGLLAEVKKKHAMIDPAVFSQFEHDRYLIRLRLPRSAINLMVLFGLCGAVYGVFNAFGTVQIQENADIVKALNAVVGSSRSGLLASFGGIFGSAILLFLSNLLAAVYERFLVELDEVFAVQVYPLFSFTTDTQALSLAAQNFQEGSKLLLSVSDQLTEKAQVVAESINDFYTLTQSFGEGAQKLSTVGDGIIEAHKDVLKTVKTFAEQTQGLQAVLERNGKATEETLALLRSIQSESKAEQESRLQLEDRHQQSLAQIREALSAMENIVKELKAPALDLYPVQQEIQRVEEKQQEQVRVLREMLEALQTLASAPTPTLDSAKMENLLDLMLAELKATQAKAPPIVDISGLERALTQAIPKSANPSQSNWNEADLMKAITSAIEQGFKQMLSGQPKPDPLQTGEEATPTRPRLKLDPVILALETIAVAFLAALTLLGLSWLILGGRGLFYVWQEQVLVFFLVALGTLLSAVAYLYKRSR